MKNVVKQCIPSSTSEAFFDFQRLVPGLDLSPFCADTLIEVASLAGAVANLNDRDQVMEIVHKVLQQLYKRHIGPQLRALEGDDSIDRHLIPVAGASLLLPTAVYVARVVAKIEPRMKSCCSVLQQRDDDSAEELEGGEEGDTFTTEDLTGELCNRLGEKMILLRYARRLFKYIKQLHGESSSSGANNRRIIVTCILSALQNLACLVQDHILDLGESAMDNLVDPELNALMFTNQIVNCSAATADLDLATIARVIQVMNRHRPLEERSSNNIELLESFDELIQCRRIPLDLALGGVRFLEVGDAQDAIVAIKLLRATLTRAYSEGGNQGIKGIESPLRCIISSIFAAALPDQDDSLVKYGRFIQAGDVSSCFSDDDLARALSALLREIIAMPLCDEECAWDSLPMAYMVDAFVSISETKNTAAYLWDGLGEDSAPEEACQRLHILQTLITRLVNCFQTIDFGNENSPLQFLVALGIAREVVCQSCPYIDELLNDDEDVGGNDDKPGSGDEDEDDEAEDDKAEDDKAEEAVYYRRLLLKGFVSLLNTTLVPREEQSATSRYIALTSTLKMPAEAFLPPFAALFMLASSRGDEFGFAVPGVAAVRRLRDAVFLVDTDLPLYSALHSFSENRTSNALGLTLFAPEERDESSSKVRSLKDTRYTHPDEEEEGREQTENGYGNKALRILGL